MQIKKEFTKHKYKNLKRITKKLEKRKTYIWYYLFPSAKYFNETTLWLTITEYLT